MKLAACAIVLCGTAAAQPIPEGWQGLGTHVEVVCGIDDTILRFERRLSRVLDGVKLPSAANTARTHACTACIAADRAIRTFAPIVADAAHHHELAKQLRALPAITTRAQARAAQDAIEPLIDAPSAGADEGGDYDDALFTAFEAVELAAEAAPVPDAKGCFAYEGGSEYDSFAGDVLAHALELDVPKSVVRREAARLLRDLVKAAR
jgi:hypothetical protein